MSITDELRKYVGNFYLFRYKDVRESLTAIADRIDAEHEAQLNDAFETRNSDENLESDGWIRLPKDADGEPIHIGDEVYQVEGGWVYTVESIRFYHDNTTVTFSCKHGFGCDSAHNVRHYHKPTVEDVLCELVVDWDCAPDGEEKMAVLKEYAAKLKLAEGEDA